MFPSELESFVSRQYENLPELKNVALGVCCSDELSMAEACAVSAIAAGATQIRAAAYPIDSVSLASIARVLAARSDSLDATCKIRTTELTRITEQIERMCKGNSKKSAKGTASPDADEVFLTAVVYPNVEKFPTGATKELIQESIRNSINQTNRRLPGFKQIKTVELRDTEFEKTPTKKIKRFLVK